MKALLAILLNVMGVSVDLSTLAVDPRWCTPDKAVCIEGPFVRNVGVITWRGLPRWSYATTEPGVPFVVRFDPPVREFWWRTLPVTYGCHTPTIIFCGESTYDQASICQMEWRIAGCYPWNGGTPVEGWQNIDWAAFYDAELWDLVIAE